MKNAAFIFILPLLINCSTSQYKPADSPLAISNNAVAGITLLCALWWIFEPVPIPFTSMLPLALFPMFGILTPTQVGAAYGSPLILLLLGGFMISEAYRRSEAALVAPFEYVAMPLAVLWGLSIFGEWPDALAWAGIGLIMISGLVLIWREAAVRRKSMRETPKRL